MRVLRFRAYYFPEITSSNHLSDDIDNALIQEKITYINYTPTPTRGVPDNVRREYAKKKHETLKGGHLIIHRFSMFREGRNPILRALRYLLCNIAQYCLGVREKDIDLVYSASTPPTQGLLCAKVAKRLSKRQGRKVPFIYNLQDVFPDSLVTTGLTKKGSILWKIGRKIENYTYAHADHIIVISESMKKNIMDKGVPEDKITVVSNWIDTEATRPVPREENRLFEEFGLDRGKFTVVYAGNFGKAQGAGVVLDAAKRLADESDVQFVIFGGGAGFDAAKTRVAEDNLTNVTINRLLPQERVPEVYSLGDVALITCKKGVGDSGMPSKTWSIMACDTPIIAAFDTESELADILRRSGAGVSVDPENAEALAEAILALKRGENRPTGGRAYVCEYAEKKVCTEKYVKTIRSCANCAVVP